PAQAALAADWRRLCRLCSTFPVQLPRLEASKYRLGHPQRLDKVVAVPVTFAQTIALDSSLATTVGCLIARRVRIALLRCRPAKRLCRAVSKSADSRGVKRYPHRLR